MEENIRSMADEAGRLAEEFTRLTAEQRTLLSAENLDAQALNQSLAKRQTVLTAMQPLFETLSGLGPEGGEHHARLCEILERAKALDDQNIELAKAQADALKGQARQMTQTRKGVSGYGRSDLAGAASQVIDKTQ